MGEVDASPEDEQPKGELFHVVLGDGRLARLTVSDDELTIDSYRFRHSMVAVLAIATAAQIAEFALGLLPSAFSLAPIMIAFYFVVPFAREQVRRAVPVASLAAIGGDQRRITVTLSADSISTSSTNAGSLDGGTLAFAPRPWQIESLLDALFRVAPGVAASPSDAGTVRKSTRHRTFDWDFDWLPYGRIYSLSLAAMVALAGSVLIGGWSHLIASSSGTSIVVAYALASVAVVLWALDAGTWRWLRLRRVLADSGGAHWVSMRVRRGPSPRSGRRWTSITMESAHGGVVLVRRRLDIFDTVVVLGVASVAASALTGGPSILWTGAAYACIAMVSGYPRRRFDVEMLDAEDLIELTDDHGAGILRMATETGTEQIDIEYPIALRTALLGILRRARVPVRVVPRARQGRIVGSPTASDRLIELGSREDPMLSRDG